MEKSYRYQEQLQSNRTQALFILLSLVFFVGFLYRTSRMGPGVLAVGFLVLSLFFLFYYINFRTLDIKLGSSLLLLKFGLFSWRIKLDNIEGCHTDRLPLIYKYGGAGVHFMLVRGRYRVSFNFLEHPRIVVSLKRKAGLVRDVSFSTQHPEELINELRLAVAQAETQ